MARIELSGASVVVATTDGDREILAPTTLSLTERRIGVIGANGSGKSTMARLLNGLVQPTAGRVRIDGVDVAKDGGTVRRRVAFCFTDPAAQLVMPTCVEDVELSLRRTERRAGARRARAMAVLADFGLTDHAHASVHAISGGQKQLLALAGVLAAKPDVLVADEPTTLLDLRNSREVGDLLFALPQQLVLVTHDLDLARRCDRVVVLDHGKVVADDEAKTAVDAYVQLVGGS